MKKYLYLIILIAFSTNSYSSVFKISYLGLVYSERHPGSSQSSENYDFGYSIGDYISGSFFVDTNIDNTVVVESEQNVYFSEIGGFVSTFGVNKPSTNNELLPYDTVSFTNKAITGGFYQQFFVQDSYSGNSYRLDGSLQQSETKYVELNVYGNTTTDSQFLESLSLNQSFSISKNQLEELSNKVGSIYIKDVVYDEQGIEIVTKINDVLHFELLSLSYHALKVNSPTIVVIQLISFLFIFFRNRKLTSFYQTRHFNN